MPVSKRSILIGAGACVAIATILIILSNYFGGSTKPNKPTNPTTPVKLSASSCGASNQTLCGEESTLERYVKLNDFSDILQNEMPVLVECNGSSALQSYCVGGTSNVTIQLYKVYQSNQPEYKTRNQFIDSFMAYASQNGPFSYKGTTKTGNVDVMTFTNSAKHQTLTLTLTDSTAGWNVAYPSTSS